MQEWRSEDSGCVEQQVDPRSSELVEIDRG